MKIKLVLISLLATSRILMAGISPTESEHLQFMREEEKLAHDVYTVLYQKYGNPQFGNISFAEQRHTESVSFIMARYGVEDPSLAAPGKFSNQDLQALYDALIAKGLKSREDAFKVGILIEETDIADLDAAIEETSTPDLINLFENLKDGSYNHLKAFTKGLESLTATNGGGKNKGRR